MGIWAEALALIGEITDRVDLLYEASNKISQTIDAEEEEDPYLWYSHGMCLNAFGRYYKDNDYFYQAIEKFQYGLSLDRTCHRLWHMIAQTYSYVGKEEDDIDAFEKAVRFSAKALGSQFNSFYLFNHAFALANLGEMKDHQALLEQAASHYEHLLNIQKNALYIHPEWLFHYATTLDLLGDYHEEESYYLKSIEILSQVLMVDPDFSHIHHRLSLAFSHLGELKGEVEYFHRAIHHSRVAVKNEEENDQAIVDWGVTLINLAQHLHFSEEIDPLYNEAEHKLTQAAKLGNQQAYYHLGCLYSLLGQYEKAMHFIDKSHQSKTLPSVEEMLDDEWLEGLRMTSYFQEFLSYLERK
jgi:tetratricopeptide (TPR) repeat protein